MDSLAPNIAIKDGDIVREEASINRIAWVGGVAVALVTVATLAVLMLTADAWWQYTLYSLLAGVPFGYALFCNVVMRRLDLALFARYRSQLMGQLTDLQEMVYRDELTGLYNRRHFYEVLRMEVEKAKVSKQPLAVMILDLDGLKLINDEYGHGVGDIVLGNIGRTIGTLTRSNDVPARLGGDEFGIVMPSTDKRGSFALARRLWSDLESTPMYQQDDFALNVSMSIGLAGYPWGGESVEELIQWADADMYANKVSRKIAIENPQPAQAVSDIDKAPDDYMGTV